MNVAIFHSVNSGLYFWDGIAGLLIDGIHAGREQGFSPMPEFLARQSTIHTGLFAHIDGMLFTHLHPDHFQRTGLLRFLNSPDRPCIYGPGLAENCALVRPIRPGMSRIQMAGIYILAKDTVHDGEQFGADCHQSYLIRMGGETFFIAGDAALTPEDATALSGFYGGEVDCGFFNLYQLSSPEGQAFLRILKPKRIFLEHLPFREDDQYHYRHLARQVVRNFPEDLPQVEILHHMAWVDQKPAQWEFNEMGAVEHALLGITQHRSLL